MRDLLTSLRTWRKNGESQNIDELEMSDDAVANLKWDEYALTKRNPRLKHLFKVMEESHWLGKRRRENYLEYLNGLTILNFYKTVSASAQTATTKPTALWTSLYGK